MRAARPAAEGFAPGATGYRAPARAGRAGDRPHVVAAGRRRRARRGPRRPGRGAAWVRAEVASREPLIDMRMMRIHGVWTTNLVAFLVGVGMYSSFILIPQFVQEPKSTGYGFGASIVLSGLFLVPSTVTMVGIGQFTGRIERRFGSKPP